MYILYIHINYYILLIKLNHLQSNYTYSLFYMMLVYMYIYRLWKFARLNYEWKFDVVTCDVTSRKQVKIWKTPSGNMFTAAEWTPLFFRQTVFVVGKFSSYLQQEKQQWSASDQKCWKKTRTKANGKGKIKNSTRHVKSSYWKVLWLTIKIQAAWAASRKLVRLEVLLNLFLNVWAKRISYFENFSILQK